MIVYDLHCDNGHRFEGWFGSSTDYETQRKNGLVDCPECGSNLVDKAPMAPAVGAKASRNSNASPSEEAQLSNAPMPPEVADALKRLAKDEQLVAYKHNGFWQCMDTLRDKEILEKKLRKKNIFKK